MPVLIDRHFRRQLRPRPDQAHLALKDVPELRQFVEAESSQPPPGCGQTRIVAELEQSWIDRAVVHPHQLGAQLVGVVDHAPKLDERELPPVLTYSSLAKEDRPIARRADGERDHRHWK